jgi:hypothetical protein
MGKNAKRQGRNGTHHSNAASKRWVAHETRGSNFNGRGEKGIGNAGHVQDEGARDKSIMYC